MKDDEDKVFKLSEGLAEFIFRFYGELQESSHEVGKIKVNSHSFDILLSLNRQKDKQLSMSKMSSRYFIRCNYKIKFIISKTSGGIVTWKDIH